MATNYSVILASADGGGSFTFPIGTIFPPTTDPQYDDTAKVIKIVETWALQGFFQEEDANPDVAAQKNFTKFFQLFDYTEAAGRVDVKIYFGATLFRHIPVNSHGPRLRNCRLLARAGSVVSHAQFAVDVEVLKEKNTLGQEDAGNLKREKLQTKYDGRLLSTSYIVSASGDKAKELVLKFKPSDSAGPVEEESAKQIDDLTYRASWKIDAPHKNKAYLSWDREIKIVDAGAPQEEIPILGIPDEAGQVAFGGNEGPIIRRGLRRAFKITDTNRFRFLDKWKAALPAIPLLFPGFFDPTQSNTSSPDHLVDPQRNIWERTREHFFLVPGSGQFGLLEPLVAFQAQQSQGPFAAAAAEPTDPPNWEKKV